MLKLIPYHSVNLKSDLALDEIKDILKENVEIVPVFSIFSMKHNKPFEGRFNDFQYNIRPKINYGNSFIPVFHGKIDRNSNSTIISVKMHAHYYSVTFLIVCAFLGFLFEYQPGDKANIITVAVWTIVFSIIAYLWILVAFWYETNRSLPKLKDILKNR